jgi:hypothetical protein
MSRRGPFLRGLSQADMQLDWPKDAAAAGLPAIDAAVAEGVVTRGEAKAVRDVIGSASAI